MIRAISIIHFRPETKDELMDIQGIHNSTNVTDLEQGLDFGHGNIPILLETSPCFAFCITDSFNHGTLKVSTASKTRGRATEEHCGLFCLRTGTSSNANHLKRYKSTYVHLPGFSPLSRSSSVIELQKRQ